MSGPKQSAVYGAEELAYLLEQISKEYGVESADKNVLIPAAKDAMKIVLDSAKSKLVPGHGYDTGQLQRTLRVDARLARSKDRRSRYVSESDLVISQVSALINKQGNDVSDGRAMFVEYGTKNHNKTIKTPKGLSKRGITAMQREFGTVRMAARPYLRPALEENQNKVVDKLKANIQTQIQKYKAKQAKLSKG
jgi:HK97 gp10 family phage protein